MLELLAINEYGKVRREILNGREYLVAPFTSLRPQVLAGSQGPLFYPPSEIEQNHGVWNSIPITLGHPTDELSNTPVSARSPKVLNRVQLGVIYNDHIDNGCRKGEAWFDVDLTKSRSPAIYSALTHNKPLQLSTGLYTENIPARNGSNWNGRPYDAIATNLKPDHLAVFEPGTLTGACSVADGCGILKNEQARDERGRFASGGGEPEGTYYDESGAVRQPVRPARASQAEPFDEYAERGGGRQEFSPRQQALKDLEGGAAEASARAAKDSRWHEEAEYQYKGLAGVYRNTSPVAGGGPEREKWARDRAAWHRGQMKRPAVNAGSLPPNGTTAKEIAAATTPVQAAPSVKLPKGVVNDRDDDLGECETDCGDDEDCLNDCLDGITDNAEGPVANKRGFWTRALELLGVITRNAQAQGRHGETGQYLPADGTNVSTKQLTAAVKAGWRHRNAAGGDQPPADDPDGDGDGPERGSGRNDQTDGTAREEGAESLPIPGVNRAAALSAAAVASGDPLDHAAAARALRRVLAGTERLLANAAALTPGQLTVVRATDRRAARGYLTHVTNAGDQPRDERGRFSGGDGGGSPAELAARAEEGAGEVRVRVSPAQKKLFAQSRAAKTPAEHAAAAAAHEQYQKRNGSEYWWPAHDDLIKAHRAAAGPTGNAVVRAGEQDGEADDGTGTGDGVENDAEAGGGESPAAPFAAEGTGVAGSPIHFGPTAPPATNVGAKVTGAKGGKGARAANGMESEADEGAEDTGHARPVHDAVAGETTNAAAPTTNCPRCGGKMTMNDKGSMSCNCGYAMTANRAGTEGGPMLTEKDRQTAVGYLTTNCDCWKGGEKILANKEIVPDEQLVKLVKNAKRAKEDGVVANAARRGVAVEKGVTGVLTFNAAGRPVLNAKAEGSNADVSESQGASVPADGASDDGGGYSQSDGDLDGDVDESVRPEVKVGGKIVSKKMPGETNNAHGAPTATTLNEWLKTAPAEVRGLVGRLVANEAADKERLIAALVANVADPATKARLVANHRTKALEVLKDEAAQLPSGRRLPAPTGNARPDPGAELRALLDNVRPAAGAVYGAAPAPRPTANAEGEADVLPMTPLFNQLAAERDEKDFGGETGGRRARA